MKASITAILVLATLATVLAGCGKKDPKTAQPAPHTRAPASAIVKPLTLK